MLGLFGDEDLMVFVVILVDGKKWRIWELNLVHNSVISLPITIVTYFC